MSKERKRLYRKMKSKDPIWMEKERLRKQEYYDKVKDNPEFKQKRKVKNKKKDSAWWKAYREKLKQNPEWVEKERIRAKAYYQRKKQNEQFREKNHAKAREWAIKHPERAREIQREWSKRNFQKIREWHQRRYFSNGKERERAERKDVHWLCSELYHGNISTAEFNRRIRSDFVFSNGSDRGSGEEQGDNSNRPSEEPMPLCERNSPTHETET